MHREKYRNMENIRISFEVPNMGGFSAKTLTEMAQRFVMEIVSPLTKEPSDEEIADAISQVMPYRTDEEIAAFHKKLAEYGVTGYGVGPIYMKSEAEVDRAFAYAQRVGVKVLVGVPNYELLDYVEQKVKQYDIKLAIHLHGPDMPMYPNAEDIWNNVKDRDARMGMCLDIGHNLRYGSDSLSDLKKYHTRVFDIHLKDVTGTTKADKSVELGRGRIDFPLFIKLLRKYNYTGSVSLEYEKDMSNPFMGIAESVGYFRGVCYATK